MPGLVTGTEYGLFIPGAIGCLIFGVVATLVQVIRKKK